MTEIKALEKLRTAARNMAKGRNLENHEECNLLLVIANEIEAEVDRDYMRLPRDCEDKPIRVGDKLMFDMNDPGICTGYDWLESDGKWMIVVRRDWHSGCVFLAHDKAHHVQRTLEDVLREMLDRNGDGIGLREFNRDFDAFVEHYADEIRAMFGGDAS